MDTQHLLAIARQRGTDQNLPYAGRQNFLNALAVMPGVLRDNLNQVHILGSRPDEIRYQLDGLYVTKDFGANWTKVKIPAFIPPAAPTGPVYSTNDENKADYVPFSIAGGGFSGGF